MWPCHPWHCHMNAAGSIEHRAALQQPGQQKDVGGRKLKWPDLEPLSARTHGLARRTRCTTPLGATQSNLPHDRRHTPHSHPIKTPAYAWEAVEIALQTQRWKKSMTWRPAAAGAYTQVCIYGARGNAAGRWHRGATRGRVFLYRVPSPTPRRCRHGRAVGTPSPALRRRCRRPPLLRRCVACC